MEPDTKTKPEEMCVVTSGNSPVLSVDRKVCDGSDLATGGCEEEIRVECDTERDEGSRTSGGNDERYGVEINDGGFNKQTEEVFYQQLLKREKNGTLERQARELFSACSSISAQEALLLSLRYSLIWHGDLMSQHIMTNSEKIYP